MSRPVYYLKIRVKILNKMTVCKPYRMALTWAAEYLRSVISPTHSLFLSAVLQRPVNTGKCKRETKQEEQQQDGGGGGAEGKKRKKAMYYAFVLIIPQRLGDIQAANVPHLRFGRRVIRGSAGDRLQRSSISRALRRWEQRDEGPGERGSVAPV